MKHLVVCADGTWNRVETNDSGILVSTNVSKLAALIAPTNDAGVPQLPKYLEGVGTGKDDVITGGAFGWGLLANVRAGYEFLVNNYDDGDRIYLFGFSRGAYTARSLAGLVEHAGIVEGPGYIDAAIALYRSRAPDTRADGIRARLFRREHSTETDIEFIGVWDTVGAMGTPLMRHRLAKALGWDWQFHDVKLGLRVRNAYHALAIHERRSKFLPTLWQQSKTTQQSCSEIPRQNVQQVWFSGVHADIGGGYVEAGLSNLSLEWMINRAHEHGLAFLPNWASTQVHGQDLVSRGSPHILHDSFQGITALVDKAFGKPDGTERRPLSDDLFDRATTTEFIHRSALLHYLGEHTLQPEGSATSVRWPLAFQSVFHAIEKEGDHSGLIVG